MAGDIMLTLTLIWVLRKSRTGINRCVWLLAAPRSVGSK